MIARELMRKDLLTVREDDLVEELVDVLTSKHIHGAPVVSESGELIGVVTQQDIFFGAMTLSRKKGTSRSPRSLLRGLKVSEIMTAPAVAVDEETEIAALCRMMFKLRIHRVPIVRRGKLTGIVSSLDICAAVAQGKKLR